MKSTAGTKNESFILFERDETTPTTLCVAGGPRIKKPILKDNESISVVLKEAESNRYPLINRRDHEKQVSDLELQFHWIDYLLLQ